LVPDLESILLARMRKFILQQYLPISEITAKTTVTSVPVPIRPEEG